MIRDTLIFGIVHKIVIDEMLKGSLTSRHSSEVEHIRRSEDASWASWESIPLNVLCLSNSCPLYRGRDKLHSKLSDLSISMLCLQT